MDLLLTSQCISAPCEQNACLSQISVDRSNSYKSVPMCSWHGIDSWLFSFFFFNICVCGWIPSKRILQYFSLSEIVHKITADNNDFESCPIRPCCPEHVMLNSFETSLNEPDTIRSDASVLLKREE